MGKIQELTFQKKKPPKKKPLKKSAMITNTQFVLPLGRIERGWTDHKKIKKH